MGKENEMERGYEEGWSRKREKKKSVREREKGDGSDGVTGSWGLVWTSERKKIYKIKEMKKKSKK